MRWANCGQTAGMPSGWPATWPTTPRWCSCGTPCSRSTARSTSCATTPGSAPAPRGHVGARAQRLALGLQRQRVRRHPRHQRLRADHGRHRRRGARGQHLVGQRRGVAAAGDPAVRGDQGGGGHPHRVPLRPAPGRRVQASGRRYCSRAPTCCAPGSSARGGCGRRHWPRSARDRPPTRPSRTSRRRCRRPASRSTTPSRPRSPTRWCAAYEDGRFWILAPSASIDAQIRARADSMLERANPTYLREVPG